MVLLATLLVWVREGPGNLGLTLFKITHNTESNGVLYTELYSCLILDYTMETSESSKNLVCEHFYSIFQGTREFPEVSQLKTTNSFVCSKCVNRVIKTEAPL